MNIPPLSARFFGGRMLGAAQATAATYRTMFDAWDARPGNEDRSNCEWISTFCGGAVGWMAKMAIDADGRAVEPGFRSGTQLDPADGQNTTSLLFADHTQLDSEGCPYYVLPGGTFAAATQLQLGDVGVVIYRDVLTAAVLGDTGPTRKIGEGSIRLHNRLRPAAPDPCRSRDTEGRCLLIRNSSIESGVIAVWFRGSKIPDLMEATAQEQIEAKAFALWRAIGGVLPADGPASAP